MTSLFRSPRTLRGGFVLLDADSGAVVRALAFQYNPASVRRLLGQPPEEAALDPEGWEVDVASERIAFELELDSTDALERPDASPSAFAFGLLPELCALEALARESADRESRLLVFVWGGTRIVPVRMLGVEIEEEAFDSALNPIRARVGVALRVLSASELGRRGRSLVRSYARRHEALAQMTGASLEALGVDARLRPPRPRSGRG